MDLDEWDLLSDDLHEDGRENNLFSSNSSTTTTVIDMNYFHKFSQPHKRLSSSVIPVPLQFDFGDEKIDDEEVIKLPIETAKLDDQPIKDDGPDHQETVSQVFFKKLKENEFVDMKMDSPMSLNRGIMPQIDVGTYQFERKSGTLQDEEDKLKMDDKEMLSDDDDGDGDDEEGLNVWKWAMTGIGALFSFGFAAVTVSLLVLGNRHKDLSNTSKKQDLHFQFYPHDKRLKQVMRRATRFNEAITVMRGAPVTRAHITIGGYYEGL